MITLLALVANAHVGDIISGVDVMESHPDQPIAVEATFGVVIGQDDGQLAWVCHEAVTAAGSIFLPDYDRSPSGEWLATVRIAKEGRGGRTLFHSPDGCAWNDVEGLDDAVVLDAAFDPADANRAWAVASTTAGGGIHASTDGGRTWTVELAPMADRELQSVVVVDGEVLATGTNLAGTEAFVWRRDATDWAAVPLPDLGGLEGVRLRILAVSEDALYLNADPLGPDVLFVADRALSGFRRVIEGEGEILDAAVADDGVWIPVEFGQRALLLKPDDTWEEAAAPPASGVGVDGGGALQFAVQAYIEGPLVSVRGADGIAPQYYPDDVAVPLDCPAGTEMAEICEPLWPLLDPRLRGFDVPPPVDSGLETPTSPPTPPTGGCGCGGARPAGAGLLVLLAWLVGRGRVSRRW